MKYLLDTNVLSEPVLAKPDPQVLGLLREHRAELATATLALHELAFGCYRLPPSRKRTSVERYLREVVIATLPLLPYDQRAAEYHARERARLQAEGRIPPFVDGQIAAIACTNRLVLVTRNVLDFTDFRGLVVENWHDTA